MKRFLLYYFLLLLVPGSVLSQKVVSMKIDGSINPVSADFIRNGIKKALMENAECLIIHLNTPGGLLSSTRTIVSDILSSPVPVVVYVSPAGSHAGSAGLFVTLAAHIAVMCPGTNIGAAHPVILQGQMDSIMKEKSTNDASAFIRSIAEKRNRNKIWAERAVRNSDSFTETEALKDSMIDLIAGNERELLQLINERKVQVSTGNKTLKTARATVTEFRMTTWEKILNIITDPNLAYILMLMGMFGLIFELYNPGAIFPGIVGVISLILAFYAMQTLPVNYAGLALIVFALILFLLEIKIVSHGLLAIGGAISLFIGSMMLLKSGASFGVIKISTSVIIAATTVSALFFLFVVGAGLKAQRAKTITGLEGILRDTGEAIDSLEPRGRVKLQGEIWNAESVSGIIGKGEKVRIVEIKNLKLYVAPLLTAK